MHSVETDRIVGLEVGADDYDPNHAIRANCWREYVHSCDVGRSPSRLSAAIATSCRLALDLLRRDLRDPAGVHIELSDGEFAVLRALVEHPQRVLSRDQLLDFARRPGVEVFDRAIDSQISRLRRKLNERGNVELIRTVRNEGYMLVPAVARR